MRGHAEELILEFVEFCQLMISFLEFSGQTIQLVVQNKHFIPQSSSFIAVNATQDKGIFLCRNKMAEEGFRWTCTRRNAEHLCFFRMCPEEGNINRLGKSQEYIFDAQCFKVISDKTTTIFIAINHLPRGIEEQIQQWRIFIEILPSNMKKVFVRRHFIAPQ
jgi:hypothetical protein